MALLQVNGFQKKIIGFAMVAAIVLGLVFLKSYLMLVIVAAIIAFLFNPIYNWLIEKGRNPGQAALLTFIASLLAVIVPLILVIFFTVLQVESLVSSISAGEYSFDTEGFINDAIAQINNLLSSIGLSIQLSVDKISQSLSSAAESFSGAFFDRLISSISGMFNFITLAIIYIYVFMSIIRHQDKIITTIRQLNPLGEEIGSLYLSRIGAMTRATVRGQFIIAFMQGLESSLVLAAVGFSDLFFFFLMLLTVLSVIPLGAGIVTIPLGILMMLTGNVWQGALVIANHLLVVTNIDNVMRPRLVPSSARLDPALMILAVFAGLGLFGFFGIVIGPVIMIVLVTTLQVFLEVHRQTEAIEYQTVQKKKKLLARFKFGQIIHPRRHKNRS